MDECQLFREESFHLLRRPHDPDSTKHDLGEGSVLLQTEPLRPGLDNGRTPAEDGPEESQEGQH